MRRLVTGALLLPLFTGCVIYGNDGGAGGPDAIPYVAHADAGCYWSNPSGDWIWWFEAEVYDDDGVYDVVEVWADVYDINNNWVDSFELYRESPSPSVWFSDWLQYYSRMDCTYGGYNIDIVAYDTAQEFDLLTVVPYRQP